MNWLGRWLGPPPLPDAIARNLRQWRSLPGVNEREAIGALSFVVVDVETTGLDARRDRMLAIGACRIQGLQLLAGDAFYTLVHNPEGSARENILIHEIGPQAQAAGAPEREALSEWVAYVGKNPILGFRVGFDQAVLARALRRVFGVKFTNPALDVAALAATLYPQARLAHGSLDDWLGFFGLRAYRRHNAIYDAIATAELALVLLAQARSRGVITLAQLRAVAERPASGGIGSA